MDATFGGFLSYYYSIHSFINTSGEVQRQWHSACVGLCQNRLSAGQIHQLLESQTGAPHGEVVAFLVGLLVRFSMWSHHHNTHQKAVNDVYHVHLDRQLIEDFGRPGVTRGDDADSSTWVKDPDGSQDNTKAVIHRTQASLMLFCISVCFLSL